MQNVCYAFVTHLGAASRGGYASLAPAAPSMTMKESGKLREMDHIGRMRRLQEALHQQRLDGLLVTHLPNIRYLCGFTGSSGALVVTAHKKILFTDGRYSAQARAQVKGASVVIAPRAALLAAAEWLAESPKGACKSLFKIGIESEHLTVAGRNSLAQHLPSKVRLKDAPPLIEQARMVKDAEEIELIRASVQLGASLFDHTLKHVRPE